MIIVNRLTKPGDIRRVDVTSTIVRVVFSNGAEKVYRDNEPHYRDQADFGYLDAMADMRNE